MNRLTFGLSLLTLTYLVFSFVEQLQAGELSSQGLTFSKLKVAASIQSDLLPVEIAWHKIKVDSIKAKLPIDKTADLLKSNNDILTFGEKKYILYGIFNSNHSSENNSTFILIKRLNNQTAQEVNNQTSLLNIKQGAELSPGVVLKKVSSNTITFEHNNKVIEFKLFESNKKVQATTKKA